QDRAFGTAVLNGHLHQQVVRPALGILNNDVKIAVIIKDAGIEQLELRLVSATAAVLLHEPSVWELALRVLVEHFQVGMGRRGVQVVVDLFHVFAVIALAVGQAEEPLLQNRIATVPKGQRQAQALFVVTDAGYAVFPPAVSPATGMVMWKVIPGGAVGAVVLAHGAPLSLAEVRAPFAP